MNLLIAIVGPITGALTAVLLARYLKKLDDEQPDGPPIPDRPEPRGLLPAPVQEQPPSAPKGAAMQATQPAAELPALATFPQSPVHGELHKDTRGGWWAFSNIAKKAQPSTRGWSKVRGA